MLRLALTVSTLVAIAALLVAIRSRHRTISTVAKLAASSGFVLIAACGLTPSSPYDCWLMSALVLSMIGDGFLTSERGFVPGLSSFLLAHLALIAAFSQKHPPEQWTMTPLLVLLIVACLVIRWLWPHLTRLRIPVIIYIMTILAMVWAAVSAAWAGDLPHWIGGGAVLFMTSDLLVARQRFVRASYWNRALGLPLYYAAQLLFAWSL